MATRRDIPVIVGLAALIVILGGSCWQEALGIPPDFCQGDSDCPNGQRCCGGSCQQCCYDWQCPGCCECEYNACQPQDSYCSSCEYCYNCTCQCGVEVTGISGISGPYYLGTSTQVTANLTGQLPPGCEVIWGGSASFSNKTGNTATATFDRLGTALRISARTACQEGAVLSPDFTVAKINEFRAKETHFPKCQNDPISRDDFQIGTDPAGYDYYVMLTDLSTATAGTHAAKATLWGKPSPPLATAYEVKPQCQWIAAPAGSVPPAPPDGSINTTVQKIECWPPTWPWQNAIWYKTVCTWTGGYIWDQIGQGIVAWGNTYSTTQCKTWTLGGQVAGQIEIGLAWLVEGKITVTISGSWQTETSHTIHSGPDGRPYQWRYTHYQKCAGMRQTIKAWKILGSCNSQPSVNDPRWQESYNQTDELPLQGTTTYCQTKEYRCP